MALTTDVTLNFCSSEVDKDFEIESLHELKYPQLSSFELSSLDYLLRSDSAWNLLPFRDLGRDRCTFEDRLRMSVLREESCFSERVLQNEGYFDLTREQQKLVLKVRGANRAVKLALQMSLGYRL